MRKEFSLAHAALHLMTYAGEIAKVAEHWDHRDDDPEERSRATNLAQSVLVRRFEPMQIEQVISHIEHELRKIASYPKWRCTKCGQDLDRNTTHFRPDATHCPGPNEKVSP